MLALRNTCRQMIRRLAARRGGWLLGEDEPLCFVIDWPQRRR